VARRLARPEAMGQALCELLERVPAHRLPSTGGTSATVVVLLDYDTLRTGLGAAHLDTGQAISAAQARRLACTAGIVPAVYQHALGGPSVVLDLGRRTRLHTETQRLALTVRDHGCTADTCDRPPAWTEVGSPKPTTTPPGTREASPASRTADCCAGSTTNAPTHRPTTPNTSPTAQSASTDANDRQP
jgi:hypothetical protein